MVRAILLSIALLTLGCGDDTSVQDASRDAPDAAEDVTTDAFSDAIDVLADSQDTMDAGADAELDAGMSRFFEVTGDFDDLRMFVFEPAGIPAEVPLVVALHGCTQDASAYRNAGWDRLAETRGFLVLYPQTESFNQCFRWSEALETTRGAGQVASIIAMVERAISDFRVDASRVFITGLSAGGAMTSALLATYPDVFSAGAIFAGVPFRCASFLSQASACMTYGRSSVLTPSQSEWASRVFDASEHAGAFPRVSIWHGTADLVVRDVNADMLASQWTGVHELPESPSRSETVGNATRFVFESGGQVLVEQWSIASMGHAVPIATDCGQGAPYFEDVGVCGSERAADFFGL